MKELMTIAQIKRKYRSHCILLSDLVLDKKDQIIRARVVYHSKNRDKMYQKIAELKLKSFATLYTGKPPYPVILAAA